MKQNSQALLKEILNDLTTIGELRFRLTRMEFEHGLRRSRNALTFLFLAGCSLGMSACLGGFGLVFFLYWASSPMADQTERLPLWSCFAIVAATLATGGLFMGWIGFKLIRSRGFLPLKR